jgi:organic hydroperoxide reductase OsmC/OhrA
MGDARDIKAAVVRTESKIRERPTIARLTKLTKASVRDGLTCEIEDGPWKLTADMKKSLGGHDAGPDPGVLGRAAIASCLAIAGVAMCQTAVAIVRWRESACG